MLGASQDHLLRAFKSIAAEVAQRTSIAVALKDSEGKVLCAYDSQLGQLQLFQPRPAVSPKRGITEGEDNPRPVSKASRTNMASLKRVAEIPDSCIAWSLLQCCPEVQDVPGFMELALTAGPHTYDDFAAVLRGHCQLDVLNDYRSVSGPCVLHLPTHNLDDPEDVGHCSPIQFGVKDAIVYDADDDGLPQATPLQLKDLVGNFFLVQVLPLGSSSSAHGNPKLSKRAGAARVDQRKEQSDTEDTVPTDSSDDSEEDSIEIPQLIDSLGKEVSSYTTLLSDRRKRNSGIATLQCKLCPYRQFCQKPCLVSHMKYHRSPFYTAPASVNDIKNKNLAQFKVTRAIYRMRVLGSVLHQKEFPDDLLESSSSLIRKWNQNAPDAEVELLRRSNRVPLVQAWTEDGPQYVLRSQTASMTRVNDQIYYSAGFERLAVALSLQCRGHASQVCDALMARWAERTDSLPLLSLSRRSVRLCLNYMYTNPKGFVKETLHALKAQATARGEWTAVSHDVTYKPAFSIIGQTKMSLTDGECHAIHTFLGVTGACPGFSCQAKEGVPAFRSAAAELFTDDMTNQVRMLYSDSPSEGLLSFFPNAVGAAEDRLHFVIRSEYCTGERRTPCTRELLHIQEKFDNPLELADDDNIQTLIYHGQAGEEIPWDAVLPAPELSELDRSSDARKPFASHLEYVQRLKALSLKYADEMSNTDKKGRTLLSIIKAGCSYRHFGYLRNNNVFRNLAGGNAVKTGTCDNEALHRQMKGWGQCVYKQHADRLESISHLFGLYKMLANSFKDHQLATSFELKLPERRVVMLLSGLIAGNRFTAVVKEAGVSPLPAPTTRHDLWKAPVKTDETMLASQRIQTERNQQMIQTERNQRMTQGRLILKHRLREKTSVNLRHVINKFQKKTKETKNSRVLHEIVQNSLSKNDLGVLSS